MRSIEELTAELKEGVATFSFKKSDGSIREAIGTLSGEHIPYEKAKVEALIRAAEAAVGPEALDGVQMDNLRKALEPFRPKEASNRKKNEAMLTYYDLGSNGWRMFKKDNLINTTQDVEN